MTAAVRLLAVWLTPALWLAMPALIVERGPEGVWIGLVLMLAPLIALASRSSAVSGRDHEPLLSVVILLFAVGILLWANMTLAADVATWLGAPRWAAIAATAVGGWLLTGWRAGGRLTPALLLAAAVAISVPLGELGREAGVGPLGAWAQVASQPAFRFPAASPWVIPGRDLAMAHGHSPIVFDEEHRLIAPAGGRLQARVLDVGRATDLEWTLAPGQSVTLRAGDRLYPGPALRLRFEADKRVPGAPASGIAWAAGGRPDWARQAGVLMTMLFGALALLRAGVADRIGRLEVAVAGGGLLVALLWAQGWALYSLLGAPDLFLGGVTPERLLAMPSLGGDHPARSALQASLLAGALASFLASSIALRERLGALDRTGSGEIGYDLGLWAGVFAIAALASLRPMDPWFLALFALGAAAAGLGPAALWGNEGVPSSVVTLAELVGLVVFGSLTAVAQLRGEVTAPLGGLLTYPALAAVPSGVLVLWIGRRVVRSPSP
ncbi:MAG TPA: hypothetical protein VGT40_24435 [Methylomirabilota bacterium]|jgi:hypothetical protein|nr:hypothetical protein [Methylomirabilota bacterium]